MTDVEHLLESAADDVRTTVGDEVVADSTSIPRRGRRRVLVRSSLAGLLAVGGGLTVATMVGSDDSATTISSGDGLVTSEMILQDGLVTEAEYRAGAEAVVSCLAGAGIEATVDFDDPNRHASFSRPSSGLAVESDRHFERCLDRHLAAPVSLGWAAALGQIDLERFHGETIATFDCVEQRVGVDFGELVFDEAGGLSSDSQRARDAAFEHDDHGPWMRCQDELGFTADSKAETEAVFECVERTTGEDFGELTYGASGALDDAGQQALRAAAGHLGDVPWALCLEQLTVD